MEGIINKGKSFLSYWYLRYLLAIELFMVEPWERAVYHILFFGFFAAFWYFNYSMFMAPAAHTKPFIENMAGVLDRSVT